MKQSIAEEKEFLSICSPHDYDVLTGKEEMTLKEYERITYLVGAVGLSKYLQVLISRYMDLAILEEEHNDREHEIYLDYPEYYEDEGVFDEMERWTNDFLVQMPEDKRKHYQKIIKEREYL
ncbi:MAG: stathmin-1-A [Blautia sp.]|uniref:stathmin-1-A n=1 Tax=Blautia sp. TaxID=1955243 RepID=UPI002E75FD95|nr:stathmin-1-A [Blautia sp.]MEE1443826.1 stathmin-1-A [Blautia sp.]